MQGKVVGGGVGIVAASDYVMASNKSSVKLSELSIGIGPFVIAPAIERKIGLPALSKLSMQAKNWHTADWAKELKINVENILVVTDDIHLDFGVFRLKAKGSAGGHNGLKNISEVLNHQNYARFRFGVSSSFAKGSQADYVLGDWSNEERKDLAYLIEIASDTVESFVFSGIANTMNQYNKHHLKLD